MIADGEKWHYILWKTSGLLDGIASEHNDDCYSMICLHLFRTEPNLNHMRVCVRITINVV